MADGTDATVLCKQSLAVMTSPVSAFVDMRFIDQKHHHRSQTPNVFFFTPTASIESTSHMEV